MTDKAAYAAKIDAELANQLPDIVFSDDEDDAGNARNNSNSVEEEDIELDIPIVDIYERPVDTFSISSYSDSEEEASVEIKEEDTTITKHDEDNAKPEPNDSNALTASEAPANKADRKATKTTSTSIASTEVRTSLRPEIPGLQRTLFFGVQSVEMAQQLVRDYSSAAPITLALGRRGDTNLDAFLEKDIDETEQAPSGSLVPKDELIDVFPLRSNKAEQDLVSKLADIAKSYISNASCSGQEPEPSQFILNGGSYVAPKKRRERITVRIDLRQDQLKSFAVSTPCNQQQATQEEVCATEQSSQKETSVTSRGTRTDPPEGGGMWQQSDSSSSEDEDGASTGNRALWIENFRRSRQQQKQEQPPIAPASATSNNARNGTHKPVHLSTQTQQTSVTHRNTPVASSAPLGVSRSVFSSQVNENKSDWIQQKINSMKQREHLLAQRRKLCRLVRKCRPSMQLHDDSLAPLLHEEVSFSSPLLLLPERMNAAKEKLFELTIFMRTPGMIVTRSNGGRMIDEEDLRGVSLSFSILLAWLSSLMWSSTEPVTEVQEDIFQPPFHVLSMETRTVPGREGDTTNSATHCLKVLCRGRSMDCNVRQLRFFLSQHTLKQAAPRLSEHLVNLCRVAQVEHHITKLLLSAFIHPSALHAEKEEDFPEEEDEEVVEISPVHYDENLTWWQHPDRRSPFWLYSDTVRRVEGVDQWPLQRVVLEGSDSNGMITAQEAAIFKIHMATLSGKVEGADNALCGLLMRCLLQGLSVAGLKIAYVPPSALSSTRFQQHQDNIPVLAMALRGVDAVAHVKSICQTEATLKTLLKSSECAYLEEKHLTEKEMAYWFGPRMKCEEDTHAGAPKAIQHLLHHAQSTAPQLYPSTLMAQAPSDMIMLTSTAICDIGWILHLTSSATEGYPESNSFPVVPLQCIGCKRVFLDDVDTLIQLGLTSSELQVKLFTGVCHLLVFRGEQAYSLHGWRLVKAAYQSLQKEVHFNVPSTEESGYPPVDIFFSCFPAHSYLVMMLNTLPNLYQLPRTSLQDHGAEEAIMRGLMQIVPESNPHEDSCESYSFVLLRGFASTYQLHLSLLMDQCTGLDLLGVQLVPQLPSEHEELLLETFGEAIQPFLWNDEEDDESEEEEEEKLFLEEFISKQNPTPTNRQPITAVLLYRGENLAEKWTKVADLLKKEPNVVFAYTLNNHLVYRLGMAFFRQCDLHSHSRRQSRLCSATDKVKCVDLLQAMHSSYSPDELVLTMMHCITPPNPDSDAILNSETVNGGPSAGDPLRLLSWVVSTLATHNFSLTELLYFPSGCSSLSNEVSADFSTNSDNEKPLFALKVSTSKRPIQVSVSTVSEILHNGGIVSCVWETCANRCATLWEHFVQLSVTSLVQRIQEEEEEIGKRSKSWEIGCLLIPDSFVREGLTKVLDLLQSHKFQLMECRFGPLLSPSLLQRAKYEKVQFRRISGHSANMKLSTSHMILLVEGDLAFSAMPDLLKSTGLPASQLDDISLLGTQDEVRTFISILSKSVHDDDGDESSEKI